jgi:predicted CoA-substrate-specific enzyme activase
MLIAGIDIGTKATKVAIIDENKNIITKAEISTKPDLNLSGQEALDFALIGIQNSEPIKYIATTGFGRYQYTKRDIQITDITCHAAGTRYLFKNANSVIDMGATQARAIILDEQGRVIQFKTNDKCAAGAGRFIERCAKYLEVNLSDVGELSEKSTNPCRISSICAVLAESEIINHVTIGENLEDIICGVLRSLAERVYVQLKRLGPKPEIVLTGGVSKNKGMISAFEYYAKQKILVDKDLSPFAGAIGASLLGLKRLKNKNAKIIL